MQNIANYIHKERIAPILDNDSRTGFPSTHKLSFLKSMVLPKGEAFSKECFNETPHNKNVPNAARFYFVFAYQPTTRRYPVNDRPKTVPCLTYCTICSRVKKKGGKWEKLTKAEFNLDITPRLKDLRIIRTTCPDCEPQSKPEKRPLLALIALSARKLFSLSIAA